MTILNRLLPENFKQHTNIENDQESLPRETILIYLPRQETMTIAM